MARSWCLNEEPVRTWGQSTAMGMNLKADSLSKDLWNDCSPSQHFDWEKSPAKSWLDFLNHWNYKMINVYCFQLLSLGVICYTAIGKQDAIAKQSQWERSRAAWSHQHLSFTHKVSSIPALCLFFFFKFSKATILFYLFIFFNFILFLNCAYFIATLYTFLMELKPTLYMH